MKPYNFHNESDQYDRKQIKEHKQKTVGKYKRKQTREKKMQNTHNVQCG